MTSRPIYVGVGECECGKLDTRLYHVPGTLFAARQVCTRCLEARGFSVPSPRTAADVDVVDGKPVWRAQVDTQPYAKAADVEGGRLNLGHGHFFEAVVGSDDRLVGWLHTHPDLRGGTTPCQSFCAVRPLDDAPVHQVVSAEPLTLTPSLLCRTCGAHGGVSNGKWEPR